MCHGNAVYYAVKVAVKQYLIECEMDFVAGVFGHDGYFYPFSRTEAPLSL